MANGRSDLLSDQAAVSKSALHLPRFIEKIHRDVVVKLLPQDIHTRLGGIEAEPNIDLAIKGTAIAASEIPLIRNHRRCATRLAGESSQRAGRRLQHHADENESGRSDDEGRHGNDEGFAIHSPSSFTWTVTPKSGRVKPPALLEPIYKRRTIPPALAEVLRSAYARTPWSVASNSSATCLMASTSPSMISAMSVFALGTCSLNLL